MHVFELTMTLEILKMHLYLRPSKYLLWILLFIWFLSNKKPLFILFNVIDKFLFIVKWLRHWVRVFTELDLLIYFLK